MRIATWNMKQVAPRKSLEERWRWIEDEIAPDVVEGSSTKSFDAQLLSRTFNAVEPWKVEWGDGMDPYDLVLPDSPEVPLLVQGAERLALLMPVKPAVGLPTNGWPQRGPW
jgi:hypothetical protein